MIAPTAAQLDALCDSCPAQDFYVSRDAARQALAQRGQFNVLDPSSGTKLDLMIAKTDSWGVAQLERRERIGLLPDRMGFAARPEDIIISKMLYYQEGGSEKNLRDITGMLKVSNDKIDRDYVWRWAGELGLTEIWQSVLARV